MFILFTIYYLLIIINNTYIFILYTLYNILGGNDPDPWESGPSSRGGNWGGPSTSAWDNSFSDGYQQSFGAGPIRGSNGPMRGSGAARPGPYNSNTKLYFLFNNNIILIMFYVIFRWF